VLYHFGGLAVPIGMPAPALRSPSRRLIVSAAGPVAQLGLAAVVIAIVMMLGYQVPDPGFLRLLPIVGNSLEKVSLSAQPIPSILGWLMVYHLLFVNIAWAILNLLPVQPLDGGQIVLEGLNALGVSAADQIASFFGLLIAGVVAVWAYQHQETYLMFLFGVLCVGCYQRLVSSDLRG
jgi:Zn-dependent protease